MTDALQTLASRLEEVSGPSRELDGRIWCAVFGYRFIEWDEAGCCFRDSSGDFHHIKERDLKPYTASLDAALTLVERKLPGWKWNVGSHSWGAVAYLYTGDGSGRVRHEAIATTPVLALLLALIKALLSQGEQNHE